jgi:hypothetical protein
MNHSIDCKICPFTYGYLSLYTILEKFLNVWCKPLMFSGGYIYIYTIHGYTVIRQNSLICKVTIQIRITIQNNLHD